MLVFELPIHTTIGTGKTRWEERYISLDQQRRMVAILAAHNMNTNPVDLMGPVVHSVGEGPVAYSGFRSDIAGRSDADLREFAVEILSKLYRVTNEAAITYRTTCTE